MAPAIMNSVSRHSRLRGSISPAASSFQQGVFLGSFKRQTRKGMHLGIRAGDLEMKINTKIKNSSPHFFFALQFATCHVLMYLPRVPGGVSEIACEATSVEVKTHGSDNKRDRYELLCV